MDKSGMVEVFRTNVAEAAVAEDIAARLAQLFPGSRIDFDLEDCDRVLRIEGRDIAADGVINLLRALNYECAVLS